MNKPQGPTSPVKAVRPPVAKPEAPNPATTTAEVVLPSSGEVDVSYQQTPNSTDAAKKIHPRRPLPLVPDSKTEES